MEPLLSNVGRSHLWLFLIVSQSTLVEANTVDRQNTGRKTLQLIMTAFVGLGWVGLGWFEVGCVGGSVGPRVGWVEPWVRGLCTRILIQLESEA